MIGIAFRSQQPNPQDFFRIGQVFMILWDEREATHSLTPIAEADEAMLQDREERHRTYRAFANVYMGPYT